MRREVHLIHTSFFVTILVALSWGTCMGYKPVENFKYNGDKFTVRRNILAISEYYEHQRKPCETEWEVRNDSLFLKKWKPASCFNKPKKRGGYHADWFSGPLVLYAKKKKVTEHLYAYYSILLKVENGIVFESEIRNCGLSSSGHLYSGARQAYYEGQYELAHDLFAKIFYEYPDFFKNDWVLLFLITIKEMMGVPAEDLISIHHQEFSKSPSNDLIIVRDIISNSEKRDSLETSTLISSLKSKQLQELMTFCSRGYVELEDIEAFLNLVKPIDYIDFLRAVELYETLEKAGKVEITFLDIPYLGLLLPRYSYEMHLIIPILYELEKSDDVAARIEAKIVKSLWNVECDLLDSPIYRFKNSFVEKLMR